MKIGLFYGTTSAATQEIASLIQDNLVDCDIEILDIYDNNLERMSEFDRLMMLLEFWRKKYLH